MNQKTIKKEVVIQGIGVHLGQYSKVILHPAKENTGIVFWNPKFPDERLEVGKIIPELAIHASVLKGKFLVISTVEHLMSAISVFNIDNLFIEVQGIEIPILDGSCLPFVDMIEKAGIKELDSKKTYIMAKKNLIFKDEKTDRVLEVFPAKIDVNSLVLDKNLYFDYFADFDHPLVGQSSLKGKLTLEYFKTHIAPARTFGFLNQLPFLRERGLAKGSSLGNTVVIGEEEFLNDLRFDNEFVRHKLLDLLGDIALIGKNLVGSIRAIRTGHNFNRLIVCDFINHPENWELFD